MRARIYWKNVFAISYEYRPEACALPYLVLSYLMGKGIGSLLRVELGHLQVKMAC